MPAQSKCDGGTPVCSTCTLYHDTCSYTSSQDGRRPAAKSYVKALEERVKLLEDLLAKTPAGTTAELPALGETDSGMADDDGDEENLEGIGLDRLKLDEETLEFVQFGPSSAFQHLPETRSATSPSADPTALAASPSTSLAADPFHARRDSFGLEGLSPRSVPSPQVLGDPPRGPLDWAKNLPPLAGWDEELHDDLLNRFFVYFNGWCQWVDEPAFRREMGHCLSTTSSSPPSRTSNYSTLLHCALLSIACAFKDDERTNDGSAARALSAKAKAAMDTEGERPMLSTLRGLLLLGSAHTGEGKVGLAYLYAGVALRMVSTLGLGIDCSAYVRRGLLSESARNLRDGTFWLGYIQDKLWSSYVGRNPTLLRASVETALPAIDAERDSFVWTPLPADVTAATHTNPRNKPAPGLVSSCFHWTCRLAIIEEKIMTAVYALRSHHYSANVLNKVSELSLELETWSSSLPMDLLIAPQTTRPPAPHIIMLNCMYHFVVILLHRPYYTRLPNIDANSTINDIAVQRCNAAATRLVSLFELYQRCPGLRYAPIAATQIAFAAGSTHLLALVNAESAAHAKKAADARVAATACVHALRAMPWECSRQTAQILGSLIEKWSPEQPDEEEGEAAQPQPAPPAVPAAAVQALDPQSDLAKELLRLGWTPPIAPAAGPPPPPPAPAALPPTSAGSQPYASFQSHNPYSTQLQQPLQSYPHLASSAPHPSFAPSLPSSAAFTAANPYAHSFPNQFQAHGGTPDLYGVGMWPFLPTATSSSAVSHPSAAHMPIADDVFAGLISMEGRPASDAVVSNAAMADFGAAFGSAQDLSGGMAPMGQAWYDSMGLRMPQ
ncbi:hypothetical protein JCM10213v2_007777 [Rhodosporidiobolus nylandii]